MRYFRNKITYIVVAILALALLMAGCSNPAETSKPAAPASEAANSAEAPQTQASEGGQFRVGMECGYPPFNWTQTDDSNGAVQLDNISWAGGYDVEIAKRIAEGLGKELVIVKTEWDGLPPSLTSGKIDAIIAGMSNTAERRETIDFTDNYYTSDIVVVVKKDSPYAQAKSIKDFADAKITGQLNTLHYGFIDQMEGVSKQTAMEDFPTMTLAVSSGKIDGYVTERPGAVSAVYTNPDLTFIAFEEGSGFAINQDEVSIAIGIAKGSPYKDQINEILAGIDEETRNALMDEAVKNQPMSQEG